MFDLPPTVGLALSVDGGVLVATFDEGRFDPRRVSRSPFGHLAAILGAPPDDRTGAWIAGFRPELHHRIAEWNDTDRPVPEDPATAAFERRARELPEAVALLGIDDVSYGTLDRRAEHVANQLRALGAAPGTPVAVFAADGSRAVTGMLGVLRTGAVVVSLDPAWPFPRLCAVLVDVEPALIVTEESLEDQLPPSWAQLVLLDDGEDPTPLPSAASDGPAFVVFGAADDTPGVVLDHRAITLAVDRFQTDQDDRTGFLLSPHDPSAPARIWPHSGPGAPSSGRRRRPSRRSTPSASGARPRP